MAPRSPGSIAKAPAAKALKLAKKAPTLAKAVPAALKKALGGKLPDIAKAVPAALEKALGSKGADLLKGALGAKAPVLAKSAPAALTKALGGKGLPAASKKPAAPGPSEQKAPTPGGNAPGGDAPAGPPAKKQPVPAGSAGKGGGRGGAEASVHTPKYRIKAGVVPKELPTAAASRITEIVVDQAIDMADMCKIVMRNDDFAISDSPAFKPGSKLEVELGYEEYGPKMARVFKGEITAIQADFPRRGSMSVRVIAHTEYHRLMRGRYARAWENTTYADIAAAIAAECKLKPAADPTPGRHEYVFQRNQTNLEFLLELAERVGYEVFAGDGKLFFRKPTPEKGKFRTLKRGELLLSFSPRSSISLRPTGVKVRSFDYAQVSPVVGQAGDSDAGPAMGGKELAPKLSAKIGPAEQVITRRPFRKADEAKALAVAMMKEASLDLVSADATLQGSPDLRPGFVVDIQGVGAIFSGSYYVTRVVHDYLPQGFSTRLGLKKTSIEAVSPPIAPVPAQAPAAP